MDNMDTDKRRERLALTLESLAAATRTATTAAALDSVLSQLHDIGGDVNGYYGRTVDYMYDVENAAADN